MSDRAEAKRSGHRRFRLQLVTQLEDAAGRAVKYDSRRRRSVNDLQVHNGTVHTRGNLYEQGKSQPCVMCQARGRRGPLQAVDPNQNFGRKPPSTRTIQGCSQSNIALCKNCCEEHLQAVNDVEDTDSENTVEKSKIDFLTDHCNKRWIEKANESKRLKAQGKICMGHVTCSGRGACVIRSKKSGQASVLYQQCRG